MQTALALSGGGYRASVFHLGVLARLAREEQLENVTFLSTVSGGSLVTGLVFTLNGNTWPTSRQYLEKVLPAARKLFTTTDMQRSLLQSVSQNLFLLFGNRAQALSRLIQEKWGVTINIKQLPKSPRWMINATCYETGRTGASSSSAWEITSSVTLTIPIKSNWLTPWRPAPVFPGLLALWNWISHQ